MTEEEFHQFQQQAHAQQQAEYARVHAEHAQAQRRAAETQRLINETPRRRYAMIAAVDELRGFSKQGEIPWYYKEDFEWFKMHTKGHAVVMGRSTYEDIVKRRGDKAKDSVLPDRKCFVVSSKLDPTQITNATVIRNFWDADNHLNATDEDLDKTIFFIGGDQIFRQGIALANTVYLTVINKDFECDRFFPTEYLDKWFAEPQMFKVDAEPDLRFLIYRRK